MSNEPLSKRQRQYIWLAGSFPDRIVVQGRGRRTDRLRYSIDREGEVIIFGFSNPPYFLCNRGLFRKLQAPHSYVLTDKGEAAFRQILGTGGLSNKLFFEVRTKPD